MSASQSVGKTVVITGAARGIGRAMAEGFHRDGWRVVGFDRDEEGLRSLPPGIQSHVADVSDEAAVQALVDEAATSGGRLDVLFNNAGYGLPHPVENTPAGAFEKLVAVHLFGALYGIRAAIPHMRRQGSGHIINTLSRAGELHAPGGAPYNAAKAALWALTRTTAYELAATPIRVNGLIPGPTNSAIWGVDRPELQSPEAVYPHAKWMAEFGPGSPTGKVFWDSKEYVFGDPAHALPRRG